MRTSRFSSFVSGGLALVDRAFERAEYLGIAIAAQRLAVAAQ